MADFDIAYQKTLDNEGGYLSADTARQIGDRGGETYKGIARNFNSDWAGWAIIDAYKAKNGTPAYNSYINDSNLDDLVRQRYRSNYWDAIKGDSIQSQDIANLLFDLNVNGGGVKTLQGSINTLISPDSIAVDGVVGNDTLSKINQLPPDKLYQQLYRDRKANIEANPSGQFKSNWLSRLDKYRKSVVEDISAQYTVETLRFGKNYVNLGIAIIAITVTLAGTGLLIYHLKHRK
jgi:lysozyme family protein